MFNGSKEVRERLDALERKHRELGEEHEKLRRFVDLEWEDLKDKVKRWMQRTATRDRVDAKEAVGQAAAHGPDPISAQLLARRARGGAPVSTAQLRAVEEEG